MAAGSASESAQKGEVLGGITQANQTGNFAERHFETPVNKLAPASHSRFPVGAHGVQDATVIGGERTDHVAFLGLDPAADLDLPIRCR